MSLVHNYQHMLDKRLSVPRATEAVEVQGDHGLKVFRNTSPTL
jgi:hypothetical protein